MRFTLAGTGRMEMKQRTTHVTAMEKKSFLFRIGRLKRKLITTLLLLAVDDTTVRKVKCGYGGKFPCSN